MNLHSLVAEKRLTERIRNFKCSDHVLNFFLLRRGLLFRKARAARRREINDEQWPAFLCALNKANEEFPPDHGVTFTQSNWHFVMSRDEVVGEIGSEIAHNYTDDEDKANFTFWFRFTQADLVSF
jgi:hypothetical protein